MCGTTTGSGVSANPVVFASTIPLICTVAATTATILTPGTCSITANQAGDVNYATAPQITKSVVINKITQAITAFSSTPATPIAYTVGGTVTFTVTVTGVASGNPVTFTSTTATVCTIAANTATILTAGNCTIAANQAGDTNHAAAPQVTLTVAITKLAQTLTGFSFTPATPIPFVFANTFTLSATAGASSSPIVFTSATANVCAIPIGTNTVTILTGGTCTVRANQAADVNYTAAPQLTLSVVITKANQAITNFLTTPATPVPYSSGAGATTIALTATAGASTSPVVFSSATTAVCATGGTNGATVTMFTIGTCTLRANQAATASYNAAPQITTTVTIVKGNQTIAGVTSTPASPITYTSGGTFTLAGTGGQSGNPIAHTSTTPTICTTGGTYGATVTMLSAGTCTINANQAGNANYQAAAQVAINITISPPIVATPQIYNIYADHLGTPRAITTADAAATKVWEWSNDEVFGNNDANEVVNALNTGTFSYNLRFPGQYLDVETKLHYNYFRDYDSSLGRYSKSDPIGLKGGLNTFEYVGANPLSYTDPSGLKTYQCKRPLGGKPGENLRNGPDVWGNLLYHQYSCIRTADGNSVCGGQGFEKGGTTLWDKLKDPVWSPGKPTVPGDDYFNEKACEQTQNDNMCFERCLQREWIKPRPHYGIPFATDCQEYDDRVNDLCREVCSLGRGR